MKLNMDELPKIEIRIFARSLIRAAEKFYEDPANAAGFEAWIAGPEGQAYRQRQDRKKKEAKQKGANACT